MEFIYKTLDIYEQIVPEQVQNLVVTFRSHVIWAICIITLLVSLFFGISIWKKYKIKCQRILEEKFQMGRPRFRKRDKVLFYGRRMLRKVQSISAQSGSGRKRKALARLAKNIWYNRKENAPTLLRTVEPPAEFLEEASEGRDRVPPDAFYMLQSIRIFGHFEKPVFLKICKHTEILNLQPGEFLIKIGDPDESIFIVQSGVVNVYLNNPDGSTIPLKCVRKGETVTSLLSFVDVLVGNASQYKTVTAKASEQSQVIRVPMSAFKEVFDESPDILVRVIQVIMVRLQRVTMTALHNYLGLTTELVQQQVPKKKPQVKTSPGHKRTLSDIQPVVHSLAMMMQEQPDMLADLNMESTRKISMPGLPCLDSVDPQLMRSIAVDGFTKVLGLENEHIKMIEDGIEIKDICAGTTITHQGSSDDVCLIYLISGALFVIQKSMSVPQPKKDKEPHAITVYPGEIVGGLAVLTGESSMYTIRAKHFSRVALMPKTSVYEIMRQKPSSVLDIANSVVKSLSPLVRQCDFALDWVFLESGRALYRQDEASDSTFIVLSGRLRSVVTHQNGKKEIVGEFGKGDLVGIVEMITETPRTTTVMAVRDSEMAKLPEGLFNAIKIKYPVVVTQLISLLSHRILGSMQNIPNANQITSMPLENNPVSHRYTTVAIVAVSEDVPLTAFVYELYHSLCAIGPTLRLTSEVIRKTLGGAIMESANEYRLTSWMAQQEDQHNVSLYQCDTTFSVWTQRCLRQADVILIVGLGDRPPTVGKLEREIDRLASRTAKELVLLHHENSTTRPTNTVQWLNMRAWLSKHHHIQGPKRMFTRKSHYRVNELYSKVLMSEANMHSDFSRLARWLTGNSVGLVLGGGGARGAAHVGMLKAIQEAGIPIDMVGGVSIGAFMGALWCHEKNIVTMTQKAREWCKKMTQWGRQLLDLTYPVTSMFSGKDFNNTIRGTFGEVHIEDLWIPYFTLTTDITASCARVHTHADVMRAQGAAHIIAVDVGSQDDTDLTDYGDDLSGWWLLYKRLNPFTAPVKVPNLPDIQSRLAYVSCVRQLEEVKNSDYCEYIRPPIDKYKTLAFAMFDDIKEVGFQHGKEHFELMTKTGRLARFKQWKSVEAPIKPAHALNEYTFVDLAQIVCKVPDPLPENQSSTEDEEFGGYVSEPSSTVRKINSPILKRTVSLSEHEMDSDDMEMPLPLRIRNPVAPKTPEKFNADSE